MTPLLSVENLQIDFSGEEGAIRAVDGVSFQVPQAGTVALVGESGSGKTVTAQAIMGLLPDNGRITAGRIMFHDPQTADSSLDIATLPASGAAMQSLRGGRISMIFQEPMSSLSPLHTIGDQIGEAVRLHRDTAPAGRRHLVADTLRLVGFPDPEGAVDRYPFELSGGMRQRALIAMGLVCRPALLIADEPTTALDVTVQAQILKLIKDLQRKLNMAVLLITHDLGVVANMADQVVVMHRGRVMERGHMQTLFESPAHPYLQSLFRAVPRLDTMENERRAPAQPKPNLDQRETLLRVEGVSKSFQPRRAGLFATAAGERVRVLDDVSLTIAPGECLGLVGESGSGKTTLSKLIMGALTPDSGKVTLLWEGRERDVHRQSPGQWKEYRRWVQYVFQDPFSSLNPRMTVFDIVAEPLLIHGIGNPDSRRARVRELLELVGLDPRFMRRYPHSFSGGQRQRVGIARALALEPRLLICDEPVSALDVSIQAQVLSLLKRLQTELGLTYLFITHDLAVVNVVADRIAVMWRGRIVEWAEREDLFRDPRHPYTKSLLAAAPTPDPRQRLDLASLLGNGGADPDRWPEAFAPGHDGPSLIDLGEGHLVRVRQGHLDDDRHRKPGPP